MKLEKLIQASIVAALATAATQSLAAAAVNSEMEKCYGIAKAGKNDCQTKGTSCAGTATQDRQPDAFVVLPKGVCGKIAGGSTSGS